ncbi:MAG: hypothetical protein ACPF9K_09340 [Neptuniibacter sp.]
MFGKLIAKVMVSRYSHQWSSFIDELFEQEDFLPPLHAPNILTSLKPDLIAMLSESHIHDYSYKQREELVLHSLLHLLSGKVSEEEYSPWNPDHLEYSETTRLYNKVEQLIQNKGYRLHQYPDKSSVKFKKLRQGYEENRRLV